MIEEPRDTIENRRLSAAIMQAVVDSPPEADPEADDTIVISYDELEAIIHTIICGEDAKPWSEYTEQEKRESRP